MNTKLVRSFKKAAALLITALALCAGAVMGQQPGKEKWVGRLADDNGTEIDEDWLVDYFANHIRALVKANGKAGNDSATLRGAKLKGINLTKIVTKAWKAYNADLGIPETTRNSETEREIFGLRALDLSECFLREAQMNGIFLYRINLTKANLSDAHFEETYFQEVNLSEANLSDAHLERAKFEDVNLSNARLDRAYLNGAKMREAKFVNTDMEGAYLYGADMHEAKFVNTDMEEVHFGETNLFKARWEAHGKPDLEPMGRNQYLETFFFLERRKGLIELRKAFMETEIRDAERRVTYALQRSLTENLCTQGKDERGPKLADKIHATYRTVFYDWTSRYGLDPGRPLFLIAVLIGLCAIPYALAMFRKPRYKEDHTDWTKNAPPDPSKSGIWEVPLGEGGRRGILRMETDARRAGKGWLVQERVDCGDDRASIQPSKGLRHLLQGFRRGPVDQNSSSARNPRSARRVGCSWFRAFRPC